MLGFLLELFLYVILLPAGGKSKTSKMFVVAFTAIVLVVAVITVIRSAHIVR
jgi:hypothetical protein